LTPPVFLDHSSFMQVYLPLTGSSFFRSISSYNLLYYYILNFLGSHAIYFIPYLKLFLFFFLTCPFPKHYLSPNVTLLAPYSTQLVPLGTSATNWSIVPAPGNFDGGKFGGMVIGKENRSTGRKPAPSHFVHHISPT
jgi:hypothetical protein